MTLTPGSTYALDISSTDPEAFPVGATFFGVVKYKDSSVSARTLMNLSTEAGSVTRISDTQIVVTFRGELTANFSEDIVFDLWRTDLPDPEYWCPKIVVPVERPITTRPAS